MPASTEPRSVRRRLLLGALCALPLAAQGQGSTPDTFLHAIYDPYLQEGFKGQPYWKVSRFFVPEVARTIEGDMREAKRRGEVPKLDGDPFLDAQDWQIKDLAIAVTTEGAKATGKVTFDNLGKRVEITLDLVQTPAGWRIADIKWPSGSLGALYK